MSFLTDDLFRTAFFGLLIVLLVYWLTRRLGEASEGSVVRPWQIALMGVWALAVVSVGALTHYVDDWMICTTSTVEKDAHVVVEETDVDVLSEGAEASDSSTEKTTTNPEVSETTSECQGLSVAMMAVLFLPGLLLLLPSVSNLDVAGVFKVTFRELKKSVDEQGKKIEDVATDVAQIRIAQETLIQVGLNLHLYQNAGDVVQKGLQQDRAGQKISLEELEELPTMEGNG